VLFERTKGQDDVAHEDRSGYLDWLSSVWLRLRRTRRPRSAQLALKLVFSGPAERLKSISGALGIANSRIGDPEVGHNGVLENHTAVPGRSPVIQKNPCAQSQFTHRNGRPAFIGVALCRIYVHNAKP
jgi:hypothetical protein